MAVPFLRLEQTGGVAELVGEVTTVGRGPGVDVLLGDPSVSRLHAELVRRGPWVYVADGGLSVNGTTVNGRPVARRVLADGDVVAFGDARTRIGGLPVVEEATLPLTLAAPDVTRRELEVLEELCRPALETTPFVEPATVVDIAGRLVVTEAAVKQHLLRLYGKFKIAEGTARRARLANEVVARGVVRVAPRSSPDR